MTQRDYFEEAFREFLTGNLSRRKLMLRTAAMAAAAAPVAGVVGATAAPGKAMTRLTLNQDATPVASPVPGGILKMGMQSDPGALDPQLQSLTAMWHVVEHIYSRLTRIEPDFSVSADLAESWEVSEDALVYTFKLRPGVMFHNGRAVVGNDVKVSLTRLVAPETASPAAADLASMESVAAPDDATVVLTLKTPDASLLSSLAGASCSIFPPEVLEENGDLSQVAVGSGPFTFTEYVPNTRIVLGRNDTYWEEGLPYLDGIEMLIASEDSSRTAALVEGTVDFIEYVPSADIALLQEDESIKLAGNTIAQIRMIGFNLTREPFNNPLVREAINMAVDRGPVIDAALFGYGTPTDIIFPQEFWAALPREAIPAQDIEGAKAKLAEAGFPDGFDTTITGWAEYGFLENTAIVVQEQLKQIGINAELNLLDTATMGQTVYVDKDFDMAVTGDSGFVDPNSLILGNFKTGEGGNFVSYSNAEVDDLIIQGIGTTDVAARTPIYQRIQEILLAELPWVCLYIGQQYEGMKTFVEGYEHIPTGSNGKVRQVWLNKES